MTQGIESPSRFVLLVEWDSVEAHEQNFRGTDRFTAWRAAIGPHFAAPAAGRALPPTSSAARYSAATASTRLPSGSRDDRVELAAPVDRPAPRARVLVPAGSGQPPR